MIRVKERAKIDPAFTDFMIEHAKAGIEFFKQRLDTYSTYRRKELLTNESANTKRLISIARGERSEGVGLDMELTKLRSFEIASIGLMSESVPWIVVTTKDLVMSQYMDVGHKYDIGSYWIYFLPSDIKNRNFTNVHLVPERRPRTWNRHVHHLCQRKIYEAWDNNPGMRQDEHWLDMRPDTCWSSFATPVSNALQLYDLSGFIQLLIMFLKRYNPSSPLGGNLPDRSQMDFMKVL